VISIPIAMFLFSYTLQKHKLSKWKKEYFYCLILFVYCLTVTRISAGLTWVANTKDIMFLTQTTSYLLLGVLACFTYIMYKEVKDNEKEDNSKNNSC